MASGAASSSGLVGFAVALWSITLVWGYQAWVLLHGRTTWLFRHLVDDFLSRPHRFALRPVTREAVEFWARLTLMVQAVMLLLMSVLVILSLLGVLD